MPSPILKSTIQAAILSAISNLLAQAITAFQANVCNLFNLFYLLKKNKNKKPKNIKPPTPELKLFVSIRSLVWLISKSLPVMPLSMHLETILPEYYLSRPILDLCPAQHTMELSLAAMARRDLSGLKTGA